MTEALYFLDCYLKEFEATVEKVTDDKFVVLDRTAFYPESGGQPNDTGKLIRESDGAEFNVLHVGKFNGDISHEIAGENVEKIANDLIARKNPVNFYIVSREEAEEKLSRLTTLAKGFSDEIKEVRMVEIEGVTIEACGGTHVKNTEEIKGIKITKLQNKGKSNRRMYFTLVD